MDYSSLFWLAGVKQVDVLSQSTNTPAAACFNNKKVANTLDYLGARHYISCVFHVYIKKGFQNMSVDYSLIRSLLF